MPDLVAYKRSRFSTRLPTRRMYTASHCWAEQDAADATLWRIGFTKFATRMLGEPVEHAFEIQPDEAVEVGQVIGWLEGFKASSDVYCVVNGSFAGGNPKLDEDVSLVHSDPYGDGWLYAVRGQIDADAVDVHGYAGVLDAAIDAVRGQQGLPPGEDGDDASDGGEDDGLFKADC